MLDKISNHIENPISGDWGSDVDEKTENFTFVLRTTNFTNIGRVNYSDVVKRDIFSFVVDRKRLKKNDVIIEKSGGSDKIPVGRVIFFDIDEDNYMCNNFTSILRCKDTLNSKYLFYYLFRNHKHRITVSYQNKTTGIRNLQLKRYLNTNIPIPPLPQQEKIVKVLDISSQLIEKQKELIAEYDLFLKSKFIGMFGDIKNNPYNFDIEPLSKFGKIITGNTPPRKELENYDDDFIEWIKTNNISSNKLYIATAKEYLSELGMSRGRTLEKGGLLIACIAGSIKSIGSIAMTDRKITFNQQINAIQPNKDVNSLYLYWLIKLNKNYIHTFATSSMKKMISKGVFQEIPFIKAPFDLQNKFSDIASRIDTIKNQETQKLEYLETLHKSLMDKAFKGEIK
ncbi:MAG: restriction endonuclease subunit S [Sulfurimonas sp.]|nr:restriction endonuclease subunit S [Sulfurimonas sp.]